MVSKGWGMGGISLCPQLLLEAGFVSSVWLLLNLVLSDSFVCQWVPV